jgi:hypothetical protein
MTIMTETPDARHFRLAMQSFIGRDKIHNQSTLSITSGVSRSLINEIIHGKRFAGRMAQEKIARACGLSLADFLALGQRLDGRNYIPPPGGQVMTAPASGTDPREPSQTHRLEFFRPSPSEQTMLEPCPPASIEKFQLSRKPVPMLGLVECDTNGWYNAMDIAVSSSVLTLGSRSFAVMAEGESMKPEGISRGMLCYCDPEEEPLKGDAVYVGTVGPNGIEMGTIKAFWGWGTSAGTNEGWLKLRGWRKTDKFDRQSEYFLEIPGPNISIVATVVLIRRRL